MAGSDELAQEVIDGVTVYRISAGNDDEVDFQGNPDQEAVQRMKKSGWWGNSPNSLKVEYLSETLQKKSGRSHNELSRPGVYMYLKRGDNQIFIGSATHESMFDCQLRHINAAAFTDPRPVDKFDQQLSRQYSQDNWHFYAIPMSDPDKIQEKEKELISQYKSTEHGYNT